jgi:Lipoprotein LpqB beta-propeller domain.
MITPSGTIAAHASVAAPSVHTCGKSTGAVLQPPVSASDNKVYYRDGNTKIKYLTPDGQTGDVTTVPGSASKVSFFSVSPDDTQLAVLVEDLSPSTTIKLSLYVEDLTGHTHHAVIFTNTVPKFKNATTSGRWAGTTGCSPWRSSHPARSSPPAWSPSNGTLPTQLPRIAWPRSATPASPATGLLPRGWRAST